MEWTKVEQLLTLVMLYHSSTLEEAKKLFSGASQTSSTLMINTNSAPQQTDRIEEKLKIMGAQVNDVLSWM